MGFSWILLKIMKGEPVCVVVLCYLKREKALNPDCLFHVVLKQEFSDKSKIKLFASEQHDSSSTEFEKTTSGLLAESNDGRGHFLRKKIYYSLKSC